MARRSASSPRRLLIAAGAVLSLVGAVFLLRPSSGVDDAASVARTTAPVRPPRTVPDTPPAPPLPAPAAQAVLPTPSAPPPPASDPFRAFLEAHRSEALPAASQPAASAPIDPFKAAIEAGRRGEPVPLVSPFGAAK